MAFTGGLKRRLQVLLLGTVVLVLMVAGVILFTLISQVHQKNAQQRLNSAFQVINQGLVQREQSLVNLAQTLARNETVVAPVSLVVQYATPEDYQPLVYDLEKQRIVDFLRRDTSTAEINQLAIYDNTGLLLAFYVRSDGVQAGANWREASGIVSFDNRQPVVLRRDDALHQTEWRRGELPSTLSLRLGGDPTRELTGYRHHGRELMLTATAPIVRLFPDGKTLPMGYVVLSRLIASDLIKEVGNSTGAKLTLLFDDDTSNGSLIGMTATGIQGSLGRQESTSLTPAMIDHPDLFVAVRQISLLGGERAYLAAGMDRIAAQSEIRRTMWVLLAALVLSALVVLPLGEWVARRFLLRPVDTLVRGVESVERGEPGSRIPEVGGYELGRLANAVNRMAETIHEREQDLRRTLDELKAEIEERTRAEAELEEHRRDLEKLVAQRTQALGHQKAFDEAVLMNISDGILACDADGALTFANRAARKLHGVEQSDLLPNQWGGRYRLLEADGQTGLPQEQIPWVRAFQGEAFRDQELVMERADGTKLWLLSSGQVMSDQSGHRIGAVVTLHDITLQKQAEASLIAAKNAAEDATRAKSEFLANMSHELRTPLNAILGMLYLALSNTLSTSVRNQLVKAQTAAQALLGIINDILDLSKIEAGKLQVESTEFTIDSVLERVTDTLGFQIEAKEIEFLVRYDTALPSPLLGDPLRLGQILLNLCGNAVKFTEQGEIEVTLHAMNVTPTDLTLQVCVRDTGIGMSADVQTKMFQKFTQADQTTTRRFGGTGLGLAICKNLTELMGGRIWIEDSQPGKGTTFCFTAQLQVAQAAEVRQRQLEQQVGTLLQGIRALVVDDNEASREILGEMLRLFHLDVSTATNAADAFQILNAAQAASKPIDVVLMDWRMPGMNGDIATQRIRSDAALTNQPKILMITAYGREDVIHQAEQAGADAFLSKPVVSSTLLDNLLSVLGRGRLLGKEGSPPPLADLLHRESSAGLGGTRILLVEDNEINREFASTLLRSKGIEVAEAINGQDALEQVMAGDFDAVLMDIQMPVMGGLEAARRIREMAQTSGNERFAKLPIIAMTALAMDKDAQASQEAGMNAHITKPIDPDNLIATLTHWIKPIQHTSISASALLSETATSVSDAEPAPTTLALPLTHLDTNLGIRRIGGDRSAYIRQLRRFGRDYADSTARLRDCLNRDDLSAAERHCHALKGVLGNIGASALHALVSEMDAGLRNGQPPSVEEIDRMESMLQALMADIKSIPEEPEIQAVTLPPDRLKDLIERLSQALMNDLGAVEPLIAQLRASTTGTPLRQEIEAIATHIDVFDINLALNRLNELEMPG